MELVWSSGRSLLTAFHQRYSFYLFLKRFKNNMASETPVKDIKFDSLKDRILNKEVLLIDVREPKELTDEGKIPNSINIPLGCIPQSFELTDSQFESKFGVKKPKPEAKNLVLSCRSGRRATTAFTKLLPLGYENALVYIGSFQDWVEKGGPIEK